ncbi:MAG: bifunctional diaminohydroxyphosphoribosylaminopyrimidine deaminase/5-amino-6-(5-phosphoribosylamino)uracil reductase RibD [Mariniphaga sp.]|jgi:diaminohydroxyphosphoribosylaminopyrimidine deaminase/5-amino-6-(5-phosphoribosylamino)uracil reductase|nr:bifunctional diaminohydroxyphosphoribosylaminopyrimidine deaminase/5-amino-6-(5-phosphoribosylamino)uracil reductase RibD [Mariniphaga sp.]
MEIDKKYMQRCIELARSGAGSVSPNPMVGCVIVRGNEIVGEGFHREYGEAHAEVNAVNSVANPELLKESTLYVSLEPCAHHGRTPPCTGLIIEKQIPRVVIGAADPSPEVAGRGIKKLKEAGIEVVSGVLGQECRELNKRFSTFHEKKRPYIILKWAQTSDGFIDIARESSDYGEPNWITGDLALRLVHKIRAEEDAIIVGTNTALKDNPSLSVRNWAGESSLRIVIDKELKLPETLKFFDGTQKTLILNALRTEKEDLTEWFKLDFSKDILPQILSELFSRKILSLIVEGGRQLLESFIRDGLWDEAHVFSGNKFFFSGIEAPKIQGVQTACELLDYDRLFIFRNFS